MKLTDGQLQHLRTLKIGSLPEWSRDGAECRAAGLSEYVMAYRDGTTRPLKPGRPAPGRSVARIDHEALTAAGRAALKEMEKTDALRR